MQPRREGMIWQVLGLLVVIAAALEIHSAVQQFNATFNQKYIGFMDVLWPFAVGIFAGFLLLAGAAAMISGHVLRVMSGVTHRGWVWKMAGLFCCIAGMVAILAKMEQVAMSRAVRTGENEDFLEMLTHGGFAIWIAGGYVFLLGVAMFMADRLSTHLHSATVAELQRGP
jgi:hypothetical protein